MASFRAPTNPVGLPSILPDTHGPARRLFSYYRPRPEGINVYIYSNGTVSENDPDGSDTVWRVSDRTGDNPHAAYVTHVFWGGHDADTITEAECALLLAAGYAPDGCAASSTTIWESLPVAVGDTDFASLMIRSGAVVGPEPLVPGDFNTRAGQARSGPVGIGAQYIEVVVAGLKPADVNIQSAGTIYLFNQLSATTGACTSAHIFMQRLTGIGGPVNFGKELNTYAPDGSLWDIGPFQNLSIPYPSDDPIYTLRLESTPDGVSSLYVDGVLTLLAASLTGEDGNPVSGPYVGFMIFSERGSYRPSILSLSAGGPDLTFTDDFERPDGPL